MSRPEPLLLVVAGRDSRGRAGVDADLEAARAAGARARLVVTAETIQDERGLVDLGAREPGAWLAEALAALAGRPAAVKFGLLPGAEHARAARRLVRAARAQEGERLPVVVDPVLAPSAGGSFLSPEGLCALAAELLPEGLVWTPNVPEAAALSGRDPEELAAEEAARLAAGRALLARGAAGLVLKGGHARGPEAIDLVLLPRAAPLRLAHPRLPRRLSGTGCRHASALAVHLARGLPLPEAAREAARYVAARLEAGGDPPGAAAPPCLRSRGRYPSVPRGGPPPAPREVPNAAVAQW